MKPVTLTDIVSNLIRQVKRLAILLLLTAILAASACVLIFVQTLKIEHLQRRLNLRETSWQKQLDFDQAVTNKLTKQGSQ